MSSKFFPKMVPLFHMMLNFALSRIFLLFLQGVVSQKYENEHFSFNPTFGWICFYDNELES